ncbi:MAG: hypothetical protein J7K46_10155 [Bacteroidales bacterium]|nr:hypothetical protein [Bacteroidales bacterium]
MEQYEKKAIAYMQAQRFFVEHSIKESKQVLGLSQFQTRKWQAWQHQVALNLMIACFVLEEKLFCFDDLPLLSAWDIKEWICYKLYKHVTDEDMIERMYIRHLLRQMDINRAYSKEKYLMCQSRNNYEKLIKNKSFSCCCIVFVESMF